MDSYIPASVIHDRHGVLAHHHHHPHHLHPQQPSPQQTIDPRTPRGFNLATNIHLAELQECFNQPNSEDEAEEREYQEAKRERLRKKQLKKEIKAQKKRERLKERELKKARRKLKRGSHRLLPTEDEDTTEQDLDQGSDLQGQDLEEGRTRSRESRHTKTMAQAQEQRQKDILTAAVAAQLSGEVHRDSPSRGRTKDIVSEWATGYNDRDRSESDELRTNGGGSRVVQFLLSTAGKLGGRRSRATTGESATAGLTGATSRHRALLSSKGGPSTYSDVELTTLDQEPVEQQRSQPPLLPSPLRQRLVRERSHTDQGSTILLQPSTDGPPLNGGGGGMDNSGQLLHPNTSSRSALQPHVRSHSHEHRFQLPRVGGGMLGLGSPLKQRHVRSHSNLEAEQTILQNGPQTSSMSNSTSSKCYLHRVLQKLRRSKDSDLKNKIL